MFLISNPKHDVFRRQSPRPPLIIRSHRHGSRSRSCPGFSLSDHLSHTRRDALRQTGKRLSLNSSQSLRDSSYTPSTSCRYGLQLNPVRPGRFPPATTGPEPPARNTTAVGPGSKHRPRSTATACSQTASQRHSSLLNRKVAQPPPCGLLFFPSAICNRHASVVSKNRLASTQIPAQTVNLDRRHVDDAPCQTPPAKARSNSSSPR
jgi:hypothetical protein